MPVTARRARGLTLIEMLCATVLMAVVLLAAHVLLFGSLRSLNTSRSEQAAHAQLLALQEAISRDVREAAALVESITLDRVTYTTGAEGAGDILILQLPSLTARDTPMPGVYDFLVYTVEPEGSHHAALVRRVFATRSASGEPVVVVEPSARRAERRVLVRDVRRPMTGAAPVFTLDQPVVGLAREVVLQVTVIPEPVEGRRLFPQTFTTRLRVRNR